MANLPGGAFAKGRDRIVRIADPGGSRQSCSVSGGNITLPTGLTYNFLKGATRAEFTPSPASQEFYLLGDSGWRDSVGITQAGELSCAGFFINSVDDGTGTPNADIDPGLQLGLNAESDPDVEVWVEMFTLLGQDNTSNFIYHCRAFQGCVMNVSETGSADALIEYSWTFSSRGEVWAGLHDAGTTPLDVYA